MSSETKYKCDICKKEISLKEVRTIMVKWVASSKYEEPLDICEECYIKATKDLVTTSDDERNKNKIISILKMWLGRNKK